jgi:hypothetical protein
MRVGVMEVYLQKKMTLFAAANSNATTADFRSWLHQSIMPPPRKQQMIVA